MIRNSTSKLYVATCRQIHQKSGQIGIRASIAGGYPADCHDHRIHGVKKTNCLFFSTKGAPSSTESSSGMNSTSASKCPFSQVRDLSVGAASLDPNSSAVGDVSSNEEETKQHPTLKVVPSWPIVGSFMGIIPGIGPSISDYYKVPQMLANNAYEYYKSLSKEYGDFYALDIPGMGMVHTINDPDEMMKVLRNEGAYPRGGISSVKPFIKWAKERNLSIAEGEDGGFFGQGENWRTMRTFMQSDLLSPKAAKGYVPAIVEAAQDASRSANHFEDNLNNYLNYCAFDMFQTVMFGEKTNTADPTTPTDPVNEEFVENSVLSLALMIIQLVDKKESIKAEMGIVTPTYKKFEAAMDIVNDIANDKISAFQQKWEKGELNEAEKASYIAHTFERQKKDGSVSIKTMTEIVMLALNAGVDTTSTFIGWALVHLSLNPEVQEKLYHELKQNVDENGGKLSSDMLSKTKSPYLHALLRESHRLTPAHPTTMMKANSTKDIEIHGKVFPKGSLFAFDCYTKGMNPDFVQSPDRFQPERWTAEAIEARKGTPSSIFDHQFYKDPFSQGARRCPGSRVAVNETLVLLSQLVLDWKFEPKQTISSFKEVNYEQKTLIVPVIPKMKFTSRSC